MDRQRAIPKDLTLAPPPRPQGRPVREVESGPDGESQEGGSGEAAEDPAGETPAGGPSRRPAGRREATGAERKLSPGPDDRPPSGPADAGGPGPRRRQRHVPGRDGGRQVALVTGPPPSSDVIRVHTDKSPIKFLDLRVYVSREAYLA